AICARSRIGGSDSSDGIGDSAVAVPTTSGCRGLTCRVTRRRLTGSPEQGSGLSPAAPDGSGVHHHRSVEEEYFGMKQLFVRLAREEEGQDLVEYALLI